MDGFIDGTPLVNATDEDDSSITQALEKTPMMNKMEDVVNKGQDDEMVSPFSLFASFGNGCVSFYLEPLNYKDAVAVTL